ncbi:hypothetical protein FO519_002465 [Halicephalobus sp. NKZ332]|nr:hypothetical protein FO519_002465 [Halicephalobus sp. NKZ332]
MSVNTSHTPDGRGVLLFQGEAILIYCKGVDVLFEANPNPVFDKKTLHGSLYLTTHRVIFMNNGGGNLRSFNMPFFCMRNVKLEQPLFGANYMKGTSLAQDGGNFQGDVIWKMTFPKGGCIEFGQALLRATDMAAHARPFNAPPPYVPQNGGYHHVPPPCYTPNNPEFQRAANAFRDAPTDVYVYDSPPPYSGIFPSPSPQNQNIGNATYPAGNGQNQNIGNGTHPTSYGQNQNPGNAPYPTGYGQNHNSGNTPYPTGYGQNQNPGNAPYPAGFVSNSMPTPGYNAYPSAPNFSQPSANLPYPTGPNPGIPYYPNAADSFTNTHYPMGDGVRHNAPSAPYGGNEPPPAYEAPPLPPKA